MLFNAQLLFYLQRTKPIRWIEKWFGLVVDVDQCLLDIFDRWYFADGGQPIVGINICVPIFGDPWTHQLQCTIRTAPSLIVIQWSNQCFNHYSVAVGLFFGCRARSIPTYHIIIGITAVMKVREITFGIISFTMFGWSLYFWWFDLQKVMCHLHVMFLSVPSPVVRFSQQSQCKTPKPTIKLAYFQYVWRACVCVCVVTSYPEKIRESLMSFFSVHFIQTCNCKHNIVSLKFP